MIITGHKETKIRDSRLQIVKLYWILAIVGFCCAGSLSINWYQWKERKTVGENLREALIKQDSTLASKLESDKEVERLKRKLIRRSKQWRKSSSGNQVIITQVKQPNT